MLQGYELAADAFTSTVAERAAEPLTWWEGRISGSNGLSQAFGAFHNGVLVGTIAIEYSAKPKTRHKALVIGMYVSQSHRRLGAAKALLQATIEHASARADVKSLTLTLTEGNFKATGLYNAAGFEQFGLEPMAIFTGTEFKAKVHMQLTLTHASPTV